MPVKRRSHCVCPNCLSGLNSVTENVQQRSHSCHYPGCGKVCRREYKECNLHLCPGLQVKIGGLSLDKSCPLNY